MKGKFTIRILVAAILLVGIGVFNSCKDYDDDMYSELRGDQATLQSSIQQKIDDLNAILAKIKSCNCDTTKFVKNADFQTKFDQSFADAIAKYNVGGQTLDQVVAQIQTAITTANNVIKANSDNSNARIDSLAAVTTALNTTILDVTNKVDQAYVLIYKANNLAIGDSVRIDGLTSAVKDLHQIVTADSVRINGLEITVGDMKTSIGDLNTSVGDIRFRLAGISDSLATAYDKASKAYNQANTNAQWIASFQSYFDKYVATSTYQKDSLAAVTKNLQDSINTVRDLAKANLTEAEKYSDAALAEAVKTLNSSISATNDAINVKAGELTTAFQAADKVLQDQLDALNAKIDQVDAKIALTTKALNDRFTDALSKLVTGIIVQAVENPVFGSFALPVDVRSNVLMTYYGQNNQGNRFFPYYKTGQEAAYDANSAFSKDDINFLVENCGTQIESIANGQQFISATEGNAGTVYMTVNPAGTNFENLKVSLVNSQDKESGIKIGDLKKSDKLLTFGYTRSANNGFYEAPATLSAANINSVKVDVESGLKSAVSEVIKNKGQNIDFTNLITKVYKQFDGILDANALKASWKDSLGEHSVYSQYNVAATALKPLSFSFLQNTTLPKIPTINPLTELENFDVRNYFDKSLLDFEFKKTDSLTITLPDLDKHPIHINITLDSLKFDFSNLDITDGITKSIHVSTNAEVEVPNTDGAYIEDGQIKGIVPVKKNIPVEADVSLSEFLDSLNVTLKKQMADQINTQMNKILSEEVKGWNKSLSDDLQQQIKDIMGDVTSDLQTQVNKMIDGMYTSINKQLNDKVDDILDAINTAVRNNAGSYIGKLNKYITRINSFANRINKYLENANDYLQVTMLYEGNDGNYHQLSNTKAIPSVFKVGTGNATVLLPTTYTAEIVAPAYQKFIAVTNVYQGSESAQGGNASCKNALKVANEQNFMNKVIDGGRLAIPFEARLSDAVYEITYSALDYNGMSSTRKFYVKVVK